MNAPFEDRVIISEIETCSSIEQSVGLKVLKKRKNSSKHQRAEPQKIGYGVGATALFDWLDAT